MTQWQTHKLWAEEWADSAFARREELEEKAEVLTDRGFMELAKEVELDLRFAQVYATLATVK